MPVSLSIFLAKDSAGNAIAGGLQAQDKSGTGAGPFTVGHVLIDGLAGTLMAAVTAGNALKVDGSAVTQPVSLTSTTITGTVAATQSGTWTVQPGNTANTTAWKVDGSAVTQPVSLASVPSHAVTNALLTSSATNIVAGSALATTSFVVGTRYLSTPPTFTNGQEGALQIDSAGRLIVNIGAGASSGAVAQGSTTSGQTGSLIQGAVTTSAPSYTTAQTSPLSLDTAGNLRVNVVAGGAGGGIVTQATGTNLHAVIDSGTLTANMGTVTADPFGANADAASATGSISAKLRFIAATGIPITGTVTVGSHAVTNAGTFATQSAATQSGTWTVQPGNTANTTAWKVDGSAVTQPVSGTLTAVTTVTTLTGTTTLTPGTAAANLGKAEDAAHSTGDVGVMALGVRSDTAASVAGTTGDYLPMITNARGAQWVALEDGAGAQVTMPTLGQQVAASSVPSVQAGFPYEVVGASATAQVMGGSGAAGDYLSHVVVSPITAGCGVVTILDNATEVAKFGGGGTTALPTLAPFAIPIGGLSTSGAWKITTGANVTATAFGRFT